MSSAVAKSTETFCPLTALMVTVKFAFSVPVSPSVTVTSLIDSVGVGSSSVIVPTPVASAIAAFVAFERLTVYVSFASSRTSPTTGTVIVRVVTPAGKVSVPFVAW